MFLQLLTKPNHEQTSFKTFFRREGGANNVSIFKLTDLIYRYKASVQKFSSSFRFCFPCFLLM